MDNIVATKIAEMEVLVPYLSYYGRRMHIREISRHIGRSHRTVSLAMESLESKSIVKHEVLGKIKQYRINFGSPLAKNYLRDAETYRFYRFFERNFIIKKMLSEVLVVLRTMPIIIFGSYASGNQTEESDIDMLLLKDKNADETSKVLKEFFKRHGKELHLYLVLQKDFEKSLEDGDKLSLEILRNHVIINNPEVFADIFWRHYAGAKLRTKLGGVLSRRRV